ncbi:MAG: hypothetical protein WCK98_04390 [bacterium]
MTVNKVGLNEFKKDYLSLVIRIYSQVEIEKSVSNKLSFLNRLHLFLIGGKTIFLSNKLSTLCIIIKNQTAYFGYLEAKDEDSYTKILEKGIKICQQFEIKKIFCPVDFSIWHSHRYRLNYSKTKNQVIVSEPLGQNFYLKVLDQLRFEQASRYVTAKSDDYKKYQQVAESKINTTILSKYSLIELSTKNIFNLQHFIEIYNLSKAAFKSTPGFYPIPFLVFLFIYLVPKKNSPKNKFLYALMQGKKLVGFIYFYIERIQSKPVMTLKTLIISKEHQNLGGYWLLNDIFYKKAVQCNCQTVLYAYINTCIEAFKLIPPECNLDREYGLFKLNIYDR